MKVKANKWIKADAVRIRRAGGKLVMDIKRRVSGKGRKKR